ncbi:MAG: DNA polymerase/3'-5' exonuclease PolX [Candidatus Aenigmarchaeota archaeon]|nr:DNA polymerase/3'-5' exonuclease PolX [Candidatus Aenigmarchaeota archaeon]
MKNEEIAKIFYDIALFLQMKDENVFKIRAYERTGQTIESLPTDIELLYKKGGIDALQELPGIGRAIAEKIEELLKTGKLQTFERLKKEIPVDIDGLRRVEGIGPRKILFLYKKLGIKSVAELEKAAKQGKISRLSGFGAKSQENILKGIEFLKKTKGRYLLGHIMPLATDIENRLKQLPFVRKAVISGSFRRRKETVGDIDILAISDKPEKVMDFFVSMPEVINVYGKGKTKTMVLLNNGIGADLRVVPEKSYAAALNYFTGSKDHNIALRRIAIHKRMKLSEYGLFKKGKNISGIDEKSLYGALGLKYIEPELRENAGEIEAAMQDKLPILIEYKSLKGDLQIQTNWTDGSNSIEEMAIAAKNYGLEYIAITDHTKTLAMINGLNEKKIAKQGKEIDILNKKLKGIKILKGAEVNILKNGKLDTKDSCLKELDIVGIAVHASFNQTKQEMTKRIITAMENEHVDILFHPTCRLIGKRPAIQLDIEKIIDIAKSTGTILEINSMPDRLDLKDEHIRMAVKAGVRLVIDTDAHSGYHFPFLELGIAQARRGWAEKKDIINAWPLKTMMKMIKI